MCTYAFMHVCKYTNRPESKYERKKVCKFLSIWLCNQVSVPPYEYAIICYCHTWVQSENFSSTWNLAILQVGPGSDMIFNLITFHPPTQPLGQKSYLKDPNNLGMSNRLLDGLWNVFGNSFWSTLESPHFFLVFFLFRI